MTVVKLWPWAAAILSGVLLALCFPAWNIDNFIWFWAFPLLAALWFSGPNKGRPWRRAWRGWWIGYVSGLAFFLINLSWLGEVSMGGAIALPAYLAVYFGFWGAFAATVGRWDMSEAGPAEGVKISSWQKMFAPSWAVLRASFLNGAMWCGLEWLRGVAFTGMGWNGLGVALHENLYLIQIVDIIGVSGLSFVLMFCACISLATIVRLVHEFGRRGLRPHLDFTVGIAMIMGVLLYGLNRINRPLGETKDIRALLVQMNVPIDQKWDETFLSQNMGEYYDLTTAYVESSNYDLVVWPETAVPGRLFYPWVQEVFNRVLATGDFYLMSGIEEEVQPEEVYNAAVLMKGSAENYQIYRKAHLVPFGEYIPLRGIFPPFEWVAGRLIPSDFEFGKSFEPMVVDDGEFQIIPLICFEDTIGRLARKFVRAGEPQIIVNVTNDGWFWESAGSTQHLANARFRCIELRRPMVRAANTGVSCFIDELGSLYDRESNPPFGRKIADDVTGSTFVTGVMPGTVRMQIDSPMTIYARFGDWFSIGLGGVALGALLLRLVSQIKRNSSIR